MNTEMVNVVNDNENSTNGTGSNHHPPPVLIPITFPPETLPSTTTTTTTSDDTENATSTDHGTGSKQQLQEWAMIEINGELLLPPLSSVTNSAASTHDGMTSSTTTTTVLFDTRNNIELGSISFETTSKESLSPQLPKPTPIMIIGTHELRGTIIELPQPFLCLQKHVREVPNTTTNNINHHQDHDNDIAIDLIGNNDDNHIDNQTDTTTTTVTTTEYFIRGIVKYKFIFNQYPKTIMR